jgi:hypothetical protein
LSTENTTPPEAGAPAMNTRFVLVIVSVLVGVPLSWSFLAGLYGIEQYDPLWLVADLIGYGDWWFWIALELALVLFFLDWYLESYNAEYKDELYGLLKDIGEQVKSGLAVEAAVKKSAGWKSSPPARAMQRALELAEDVPFDAALRKVAYESGQPAFREVGGLMAVAIETGGDVGTQLRWLGGHLSTLRQNEKEFQASIESSLRLLRAIALLAAPFMYYWLQFSFDRFNAHKEGNDPATVAFFVYGVVMMAILDGLVYSRWERVPSKLPLYLGLLRFCLFEW